MHQITSKRKILYGVYFVNVGKFGITSNRVTHNHTMGEVSA